MWLLATTEILVILLRREEEALKRGPDADRTPWAVRWRDTHIVLTHRDSGLHPRDVETFEYEEGIDVAAVRQEIERIDRRGGGGVPEDARVSAGARAGGCEGEVSGMTCCGSGWQTGLPWWDWSLASDHHRSSVDLEG